MYSVYGDGICIYNDLYLSGAVNALTPKLNLSDNSAGSLEITLPVGNAGYEKLERLSSEIIVKRDKEEIWAGRIISEKVNFQNSRVLTCEGEFAYFNDTTQPPTEYNEIDVYSFILALINEHNSKVEENKQFEIGSITVQETISRVTDNETTMDAFKDHLIDKLGGHMRVRRVYDEGGKLHKYVDYLKDYPNTNGQTIRFGGNLLDFTRNWDMSEYATVLMPRGAKLDESPIESVDAYLDVSSVNGGSRYVTNEEGIKRFGWIELVVDFEDVTEPEELLQKSKDYLGDEQFDDVVIDVSAVDLRYLSKDTLPINLLDNVRCISHPHGMDRIFPVTELSIQLDNPANSTYTLGDTSKESALTASTRAANAEILERIKSIPNEKTVLDKAQDNATSIINMATQGYVTIIKNQNGSEYLAVSSENANNAYYPSSDTWKSGTKLWKWSVNGLGYSKDGGRTFGTAITMDGAIVANYVTTGTMSADRIRTGILESSEEYDAWSSTKYYYTGDGVVYNGKVYKAVRYVGSGKQPGVTYWSEISTTTGATEWSWSTSYTKGDIVSYDDKYWVALVSNKYCYPGVTYWVQTTKKNVTFDLNNGSLSIMSGSISLGYSGDYSYKFQVTDDGYLTAEYGKIGGFTISAYSIYNDSVNLNSNGINFTAVIDGSYTTLGHFHVNEMRDNASARGLNMNIEHSEDPRYTNWGYRDNASDDYYTMKFSYISQRPISSWKVPDDSLVLGAQLYLNQYSLVDRWQGKGTLYESWTVLDEDEEDPYPIRLYFDLNIKSDGTLKSWKYIDCYIVNGIVMR